MERDLQSMLVLSLQTILGTTTEYPTTQNMYPLSADTESGTEYRLCIIVMELSFLISINQANIL